MKLSQDQLSRYAEDGFLILPELFSAEEVALLQAQLPALFEERCPENYREKDSDTVRTAFALHRRNALCARMARHPRLLGPAAQLIGEPFYLQQCKVNVKEAFTGEAFQWHFDFATHHAEDGVPQPLALNLHLFLDDVNEFNGPLHFIRGSHRRGPVPSRLDTVTTSYPLWAVGNEPVSSLIAAGGLVSAKGRAGTGLIFGDLMVHSSPPNNSPWPRRIYSNIVNPVSNALTSDKREPFQHERDITPLTALDDDCLFDAAA